MIDRLGSAVMPVWFVLKGLLGLTNIYDTVMSLLSCACEFTSMVLSCLIYRRLRHVQRLKPLTRALSMAELEQQQFNEDLEFQPIGTVHHI